MPAVVAHPRALAPIRSASVLIPTWQGMEFLERVLDRLAAQETEASWDVVLVDSGSSDGTLEYALERARDFPVPFRAYGIPQVEFDHGDTRNKLATLSEGDLLVFLSQDAIPSHTDWLATLISNFEDPRVGAAYCRNVHREEAQVLTKLFTRSDPGYAPERRVTRFPDRATYLGLDVEARRHLLNFNDVASAIRRELWSDFPFPRTMMGEDVLIARAILEAGYDVVYDAEATVDHSHDYEVDKMRWRGRVDAGFNAEWLDRLCVPLREDVDVLARRLVAEDVELLREQGFSEAECAELGERALALQTAFLEGMHEGSLFPARYPRSAMRATRELAVLMVVDGSGPAAEYAGELADALRDRGHRVELANPTTNLRERLQGGGVELVHFLAPGPELGEHVEVARLANVATLATVLDATRAEPAALAACDLCTVPLRAVRDSLASTEAFAPNTLVAYRSDRFPDPDTNGLAPTPAGLDEEARELEYRYLGLASIDRVHCGPFGLLLDRSARQGELAGRTAFQADDWLMLFEGASVAFPLEELPPGRTRLELELHPFAAKRQTSALGRFGVRAAVRALECSGRVLLDGREVARLDDPLPARDCGSARWGVALDLPADARELRVEARSRGLAPRGYLRLRRVTLRRADDRSGPAIPRMDRTRLLEQAEALRVEPGLPVDPAELPRLTVVIPNLDGREVLAECLASLAASDYPSDRLATRVVDNGSTDDSVAYVREHYTDVELRRFPDNRGFGTACNAGAEGARDGVLVFLNNDIRFEPDFLRRLVEPVARGECQASSARMLSWDGRTIDGAGTGSNLFGVAVQHGYGEPPGPEHEVPRRTLFPCGGAMAIDAAVFHDVGGFDGDYFAYYEDLDLGWRLWLLGHEVHYVPGAVCRHHHSHTSSRMPREAVRHAMIRNSLLTCIKNYDDENLRSVFPAMVALAAHRAALVGGVAPGQWELSDQVPGEHADRQPWKSHAIGALGAADLSALRGVLEDLDAWMERRREIQVRRVRPDAEILPLFLEPDASAEGDASYRKLQSELFSLYGLDRLR